MAQSTHKTRLARILLPIALASTLVVSVVYLIHPRFISAANNRTTDAVLSLAYTKPPASPVVIVDVDERSLARYGQWPWSRDLVAKLLGAVQRQGATTVGLDVILAEPDRTSGPEGPGAPGPGREGERGGHDQVLARTLAGGPFVLGCQFLFSDCRSLPQPGPPHAPGIVWIDKAPAPTNSFFTACGVVKSQPLFEAAVAECGFLNAAPDPDGILRRVPLLIRYEERLYPALALAMLLQREGRSQLEVMRRSAGGFELFPGGRSIPLDPRGNLLVRFSRRADAIPRVSAAELLEGNALPGTLRGKVALVGASAAGLEPVYQTPAGALLTHADLHAQVLENLLTGRWVVRGSALPGWEVLAALALAALTALAVARLRLAPSVAASGVLLAVPWAAAVGYFRFQGELLSPLLPNVAVLLNYAVLNVVKSRKSAAVAEEVAENTLVLLKSSEKNLDAIIKAVPDIIFRLDRNGRITFVSPAVVKYTEDSQSLIGKPIFDLVAPEDRPKARYRLNERRTGERATHGLELRLLLGHHGPSAPAYFSISAEGIYAGDAPGAADFVGTQGIMRDITEQKKLEEKLMQAQKMEAIGHLAAGVAHDLNNILVGLVAYPDLLLLDLPPDSPLREKIAPIQRSGQKAAAIVQDLLTLGRRGMKNGDLVHLNQVVADYLGSLEYESAWKEHANITVEQTLAPDLLNVAGSKVHLAKVVMNLLNNAAEAMPAGGTIRVASENRYLDVPYDGYETVPPGEYVCLRIADEGVGIAREDLHHIFEPFFSKKSMRRSGSGLGMTVIWATVKDHGGFLDVRSREGEGTEITIYFPATRKQDEYVSEAHQVVLEQYLGTERILVVDDMPEQLQVAANMLAKLGYAVTALASGEAALEHLGRQQADLVVLDMVMPGGMDGLESYRRMLQISPGQRAIITSGFAEADSIAEALALGVGAYVQKPYTLEKLGMAVRKELDRPRG
ncbi:CHASE2 domain-containing protein [Geomesophilobacter sediminis]|uniref:histidine kinase n=1 Tax=Geomesophilobacter sediminis TaxID=2798584 RepID=A0A8J7M0D1_9BACT|nr:CHASE2 domain-containing protein [Geomesophilobacter sediminis]MBJ6724557.1 CHASE2 domain-containing protein [Geomesophilobacter sediminis]